MLKNKITLSLILLLVFYAVSQHKPAQSTSSTFMTTVNNRSELLNKIEDTFPNSKIPKMVPLKVPMLSFPNEKEYPVYGTLSFNSGGYKITFSDEEGCDETGGTHCELAAIEVGNSNGKIKFDDRMIPVSLHDGITGYYSLYSCDEGTGLCGGGRLHVDYKGVAEYIFYAPIDTEKVWIDFVNSAIDSSE